MPRIIPFHADFKEAFRNLNLGWLDAHQLTEGHDLEILDDPETFCKTHGGEIFLMVEGQELVGSVALFQAGSDTVELGKMAVAPKWQGQGYARHLMEFALKRARDLKQKKVILYSNHKLQRAIRIYEQYGFVHVEPDAPHYQTADVKMEYIIPTN